MSVNSPKLFLVHCADFRTIWDIGNPMDWEPPFEVREAGVFIPSPSEHTLCQLTPAELVYVANPTGSPDELVLSFPCSLEQMMRWGFENGLGNFSNTRLIDWMRGRVEINWRSAEQSTLDPKLDQLFELEQEEAEALMPSIEHGATHPTYPCSLHTLLKWCDEAREKWPEDDPVERPHMAAPPNESIVRLIKERLKPIEGSSSLPSDELTSLERSNRENIIVALGGLIDTTLEVATRSCLNQVIAELCAKQRISLVKQRGGAGAVLSYLQDAHKKGAIGRLAPAKDTIRKIFDEIRKSQIAN